MGSVRARGEGRFELRVYAGVEGGRRVYVTRTHAGTERSARKALARLETELEDRRVPTPGQGTAAQLFEAWWATKDWQSARARAHARETLDRYAIPHLGGVHLARLDHHPIDALYQGLLSGTLAVSGRPLSRSYVRRLHADIHSAFAWGVRKGRLGANPAARASAPTEPRSEVRAPEPHEIRLLIADADPGGFSMFVELAAATGRRRGDLLGLQIPDVDFDDDSVMFTRRWVLAAGRLLVEDLDKNRRAARLGVAPATMARLRAHVTMLRARTLALGASMPRRPFLFTDAPDCSAPWRPDSTTRKFRKLAAACGVESNLHGLRHAHITELLTVGIDVETVARRVGDDPRTIYRTYSHFRPAADRRAALAWGELVGDDSRPRPIAAKN